MCTITENKNSELMSQFVAGKIDYDMLCRQYISTNLSEKHPITAYLYDDISYIVVNIPFIVKNLWNLTFNK